MNGANFLRAIRGPVLLMHLGVLLALHQNTSWGFERTFPILIIVFGVMKLMERGAAGQEPPQQQQQPPQMPGQQGGMR